MHPKLGAVAVGYLNADGFAARLDRASSGLLAASSPARGTDARAEHRYGGQRLVPSLQRFIGDFAAKDLFVDLDSFVNHDTKIPSSAPPPPRFLP